MFFIKFIIPQNYRFKNKLLGIIDYSTAIFNLIWDLLLFIILKLIITSVSTKIFVFSLLAFPIFLLSVINFNNETPIYVIKYLIVYFKRPKVYLFYKNNKYPPI